MKVTVEPGKCVGHARCAAVAPEVYELDDNGYLTIEHKEISEPLKSQAIRGARACPERAIVVVD